MSVDPIVEGLELSRQFLASIDALIKKQILDTFIDKVPGVDFIARTIEAEIARSEQVIHVAETAIKTQVEPLLKNAIPDAIAIVTGLVRSLADNLDKLVSNIATTEDVLGTAIGTLKSHAPELAKWIYNEVSGGLGATFLNVLREIETQGTSGVDELFDHLATLPHQPPYFKTILEDFRGRKAEWQALAIPAIVVGMLVGIVEAVQEPLQTATRQASFNIFPTRAAPPETVIDLLNKGLIGRPDFINNMLSAGYDVDPQRWMTESHQERLNPLDAANMSFRNIIEQGQALAEMRKHGLTEDYATWMWALAHRILPEDAIRSAFLRGFIDTETHDQTLAQWGYYESDVRRLRELYFFIPPVTDIIHMGIRNVFNPEIVERFQLLGDYPKAFEDAAYQQGISKEWAQKYWEAHWIVPGRSEAFEMFQRTVDTPLDAHADRILLEDGSHVYNVIGRDTLNLLLREVDTPPFYRDKVTEVAYRPYTRIDIRRLHKVGLLTKAEVERAYLDLGNSPSHARKLAEFVVRLNQTATKDAGQKLVASLQRRVIELYVADKLSAEQIAETLADLGFTDAEITVMVAEANLVRESQRITAVETGVGKLYTTGRITAKDAAKRLNDAGVPVNAAATLFEKWDLAIEYRELPEHIAKHRELSKAEVLAALTDSLIDETTATSMLEDLGYDELSSQTEIHLAQYKSDLATRRTIIESIRASFINGVIEQSEASNRLDALYLPADQRDAYLSEWTLARETRTERIPIATIRDMVVGGWLTEEDAMVHLKRHRFTDDDANLLLKFWLAQPPPRRLVRVPGA